MIKVDEVRSARNSQVTLQKEPCPFSRNVFSGHPCCGNFWGTSPFTHFAHTLLFNDYYCLFMIIYEIKRHLLLGRKIMTNLESILKSRDTALPAKVCLVIAIVFPVVMYECESWTIQKAEHWKTDAFELWCWRRLLKVPWTRRRSSQSILKKISPEYALKALMLKLKVPIL